MKQAQSERTTYQSPSQSWKAPFKGHGHHHRADRPSRVARDDLEQRRSWSLAKVLIALVTAICFVIVLPFRLVFHLIAWLGRLTALLVGFSLMVIGIALLAGPLFWIGLPLFIVGLVLTLRCLD
jgi:hypothetical protein